MGKLLPASLVAGVRHSFRPSSTSGSYRKSLSNGLQLTAVAPLHRRGVTISSQTHQALTATLLESSPSTLQLSPVAHFSRQREGRPSAEQENVEQRDIQASTPHLLTKIYEPTCSEPSLSQHDQPMERMNEPNPRRLAPGEFLYDQVLAYHKHFIPLLEAERNEESSRVQERLGEWSIDHLTTEGYTLVDLSAFPYLKPGEKTHDGYTFSFVPPAGQLLGENLFTRSRQLTVVPNGRSPLDFFNQKESVTSLHTIFHGTVVYSGSEEIRVKFSIANLKLPSKQLWRLDVSASDIVFSRIKESMDSLYYSPTEIGHQPSQGEYKGTALRERLLQNWPTPEPLNQNLIRPVASKSSPLIDNPSILDWANRYSTIPPVQKEGDPVITLNASQTRAIAMMFKEQLSLVQGPPGTGKTRTIIEALRILKSHFGLMDPLLVCTYTNAAVDNLVEGIAAAGMKPLRVGNEGGIRDGLEQWTLQVQMETHPRWSEVAKIKNEIIRVKESRDRLRYQLGKTPSDIQMARLIELQELLDSLKMDKSRLESMIRYATFESADVICTTCITAGSRYFRMMDFPVVFLDEASMSTEPASLIPIMHGCKHLTLIGDHKQLPPVISSDFAKEGGLAKSLFERLIEEDSVPSVMLDTQYRMHPSISAFPSDEFYGKALRDGTVSSTGNIPTTLKPPRSRHLATRKTALGEMPSVLFIHHDNHEISRDRSRANMEEMRIVVAILEDLLRMNPELRGRDIGIISPYIAQVRMLNSMLQDDRAWADAFRNMLGEPRCHEVRDVEVKTVDGFEGREKDIVIFSTVRNNWCGNIGFLADRRRMNVALTRAKRALFVVGSMWTLSQRHRGGNFLDSEGEEIEKDVANMVMHDSGDEWRKYINFILAQEFFVEHDHPIEYRSQEEMHEFEKVAEAAHLSPYV